MERLEPWPTISSGASCDKAHSTADRTSSAVVGAKLLARPDISEPRNVGERQLAAVDMHAAKLRAAPQLRKHLARIEQMVGVEGAFDPHLLVEVDLVEHLRHQVALLHAHAVLARQHPADPHAQPQYVGAEFFGLLQF